MVGNGTHEAKVVGSNPSNNEKNCVTENIYFNTQKNDAHHLCVDIGDGLRQP